MSTIRFLEYRFFANALCLGERIKGAQLRPTSRIIRYSQIVGALRAEFGFEFDAVGVIDEPLNDFPTVLLPSTLTQRVDESARAPLQVEVLTDVRGRIYIVYDETLPQQFQPESHQFLSAFRILLGALSHRSLGATQLTFNRTIELDLGRAYERDPANININAPVQPLFEGTLCTRIPLQKTVNGNIYQDIPARFGITVKVPFYGYLFNPLSEVDGEYVLSIYEKSKIIGPFFLTEEGKNSCVREEN